MLPVATMQFSITRGGYTPLWDPKNHNESNFDISPAYADIYTSLDPKRLQALGIKYIVINSDFIKRLPPIRQQQIFSKYFKIMFISPYSDINRFKYLVLMVDPSYYFDVPSLAGTLSELSQLTDSKKTYYIDDVSNFKYAGIYRPLYLILHNNTIYADIKHVSTYIGQFQGFDWTDVQINDNSIPSSYDYLILSNNTDPKKICNCSSHALWQSNIYNITLYQTTPD
jgi:hypothetical protein